MRLVIATPLYPPEPGGPATYAKIVEEGLPLEGIEVEVVKFSDVRHLPKLIRHYAYYKHLVRALKTADALLALDPVSVGLPAMKAAQKMKKPFFVKVVGDYAWEQGTQRFGVSASLDEFVRTKKVPFPVQVLRSIQERVVNAAQRVIVPSDYLKEIVTAWGVPEDKIVRIYNGIDIPEEVPSIEKHPEEFRIVSAGRRVPWKGFEAIERMDGKRAGWKVQIVSGVPRAEALGIIRSADVFVLNSLYEGFPHVLVEAMTLGTPVIATDTKFHRGVLVQHGETGLLIPPEDEEALEKALMSVAKDPAGAHARAAAAKKHMEEFSVPHMLVATAHFLKKHI